MSRFPECPWRLPENTGVKPRLAIGVQIAIEAVGSPSVRAFAFGIRDACRGCTPAQLAERILATVQNVGYAADFPGDWMQPVEYTLEHGGDCEDLTNLMLAVCWILGIHAHNIWLDQPDEPLNHITGALGLPSEYRPSFAGAVPIKAAPVVPGVTWWWADTTVTGARLGEWVYDANDRLNGYGVTASKQQAA